MRNILGQARDVSSRLTGGAPGTSGDLIRACNAGTGQETSSGAFAA